MNVGDYLGRGLAAVLPPPASSTRGWTLALTALRVSFVPLLMLCNAQPRNHLPVLINNDSAFTIIMVAFALSSGYLNNVCFMMAPRYVNQLVSETRLQVDSICTQLIHTRQSREFFLKVPHCVSYFFAYCLQVCR